MQNSTAYSFGQCRLDEHRRLKVVVIGAGYSGIAAGIKFPQKVENIDLAIYEKSADIRGARHFNGYSGPHDVPQTHQFTFEANPGVSPRSQSGSEIHAYLEHVVEKYKLAPCIKLEHEVVHARYEEAQGKWHLKIRRPSPEHANEKLSYDEFEDTADFVFCSADNLGRRSWPAIQGLRDFQGGLLHSADWDSDSWKERVQDWAGKTVGVIGAGSSATGVVHALQPYVGMVHNFWGGKTWLMLPLFAGILAETTGRAPGIANCKEKLHKSYKGHRYVPVKPGSARTLRSSVTRMKKPLLEKPWIVDHVIPSVPALRQRPTPDLGYLAALCKDNVNFVPKNIQRITHSGLETMDRHYYQLDIIVCATDNDMDLKLPFPVVGRSGLTLQQRYEHKSNKYPVICTDGFPNWFGSLGPRSSTGAGSPLIQIEHGVEYAAAALSKMQRERLKSIEVKKEAAGDFDQCLEKHPRWEDYDFEHLDDVDDLNGFHWFGDGSRITGQRTYVCTIL